MLHGGIEISLQGRHNGYDTVSNYKSHDCLVNRLFRRRSRKTSKLRFTGLCAGNSPLTGEFPAQMASNAEVVSIWWCHRVNHQNHQSILQKKIPKQSAYTNSETPLQKTATIRCTKSVVFRCYNSPRIPNILWHTYSCRKNHMDTHRVYKTHTLRCLTAEAVWMILWCRSQPRILIKNNKLMGKILVICDINQLPRTHPPIDAV